MKHDTKRSAVNGFTLIEMILVMVLIGILSVAAKGLFPGPAMEVTQAAGQIVEDVLYLQSYCMQHNNNAPCTLSWSTNGYAMYQTCTSAADCISTPSPGINVLITGGTSNPVALTGMGTITVAASSSTTALPANLVFTQYGALSTTANPTDVNVAVKESTYSKSLIVYQATGMARLQ